MNDYLQFLCNLIRLQTITDDAEAVNLAARTVQKRLEQSGLYTELEYVNGRLIPYAATEKTKTPDILLCAHLDVVPADNPEQFEPRIEGDILYGRGGNDCLGNVIAAMKVLLEAPAGSSVGCIFTTDEENGGSTTLAMVEKGYGAKRMILILDSPGHIYYAQKGSLSLTLTIHGHGGHSSAPWAFDNPILRLASLLADLQKKWPIPVNHDDWRLSMAPTILQAGTVHNRIPDTASVVLNFRTVEEKEYQKILDELKKLENVTISDIVYSAPVTCNLDCPELKQLQQAFEAHFFLDSTPYRMVGATDARHFLSLKKPIFVLGVCGDGCHSACETLEISSITKLANTILALL